MEHKKVRKQYNKMILSELEDIEQTKFREFAEGIRVDMQLVHMLEKAGDVYLFRYLTNIPIKIQKYLLGKRYEFHCSPELRYLWDTIELTECREYDFNLSYETLKEKYQMIKKRPTYIEFMLNDEKAALSVIRYHPEYYVSNWDFGYEMDLLAIKFLKKKKHPKEVEIFQRLVKERETIHPSIQFEYLCPHKYTFYNENYDLSFEYRSFAGCL